MGKGKTMNDHNAEMVAMTRRERFKAQMVVFGRWYEGAAKLKDAKPSTEPS